MPSSSRWTGIVRRPADATDGQSILADHRGLIEHLHADAAWARAVADYAAGADRPVQLMTLTDATTPGGRSRAQAAAQLARAVASGTGGRVTAFAAGIEAPDAEAAPVVGELVGHLLADPDAAGPRRRRVGGGPGLARTAQPPPAHRQVTYGGPALPAWLDDDAQGDGRRGRR